MRERRVAKVTISLPRDLLDFADRLAKEKSTTRSQLLAELLRNEEEARIQALMAEGYREMAEENRRLAEESLPLANETVLQHTQWDERPNG
ncbi:MAG: ribbon-helix-helix domain-containing protein [Chloroflexota bacterium]